MKMISFNVFFILIIIFHFSPERVLAQPDFVKGYIVTTKHDTIKGFLKEKDLRDFGNVSYKLTLDSKTLNLRKVDYLQARIGDVTYEKITETKISASS